MPRNTLHQVIIGIGIAAVFVLVVEAIQFTGSGWHVESQSDDGSYSITQRDGRDRLKVRSRGKIEFEDERRVARLEAGARLRIEEQVEGVDRRLVVTPAADGSPEHDYRVDGDERPFDAEAEQWLAGVLLRVYRQTGLDAEARVRRIHGESGVDGVLEEAGYIRNDSVAATYLQHLLDLEELTTAQAVRVLEHAADHLDSDYYLAHTLDRLPAHLLTSSEVARSFADTAERIDSSHYLRRVIESALEDLHALPEPPTGEQIDTLLRPAVGLDSDHEAGELLVGLASRLPEGRALPETVYRILDRIDSGYTLSRAAGALGRIAAPEEIPQLLDAARIDNDYQARTLAVGLLETHGPTIAGTPAFERFVNRIDSEYDRKQIHQAVADAEEREPASEPEPEPSETEEVEEAIGEARAPRDARFALPLGWGRASLQDAEASGAQASLG